MSYHNIESRKSLVILFKIAFEKSEKFDLPVAKYRPDLLKPALFVP